MTWQPRRQWRRTPYYKVQVWDIIGRSWRDEKPGFDTVEEAAEYIATKLKPDQKTRLMHVTDRGRFPLSDDPSPE